LVCDKAIRLVSNIKDSSLRLFSHAERDISGGRYELKKPCQNAGDIKVGLSAVFKWKIQTHKYTKPPSRNNNT